MEERTQPVDRARGDQAEPERELLPESPIDDPGKDARAKEHLPVVPVFDGYRALAILGVVMIHIIASTGLLKQGTAFNTIVQGSIAQAVEVLFVVSGFVVFLPAVARGGSLGSLSNYFVRRAARLLPAYWMILVICMLLIWLVPLEGDRLPDFGSLIAHLLGAQVAAAFLFNGFLIGFGLDGPVWTLSLEIGFYLILPLVAGFYFRRPWIGLAVAAAITVLWKVALGDVGWVPQTLGFDITQTTALRWLIMGTSQLPNWAFSFAVGMTGAWAYVRVSRDPDRWRTWIRVVQPLSLVGLLVSGYWIGDHTTEFLGVVTTLLTRNTSVPSIAFTLSLAAFMVSTAVGPGWVRRPFDNVPIRRLGDISYGIYLVHVPIILYAESVFDLGPARPTRTFVVLTAVVIPLSIAYGYLSARYLEQPIRRWARRFGASAGSRPRRG